MKNRLIVSITLMLVLTLACLSFVGCKKDKEAVAPPSFESYIECIESSPKYVKTIDTNLTINDGKTLVYSKRTIITVKGTQTDINISEMKLGEEGEYLTVNTLDTGLASDIKAPLNIKAENVEYHKLTKNGFICIVGADKVNEVFGINDANVSGETTVTCSFYEKKLATVVYEMALESGKIVTVEVSLGY